MQMLYCSDVSNVSMRRPPDAAEDVLAADNESSRTNETQLQYQATDELQRFHVERRFTETVYLVTRYYVYHGVTRAAKSPLPGGR